MLDPNKAMSLFVEFSKLTNRPEVTAMDALAALSALERVLLHVLRKAATEKGLEAEFEITVRTAKYFGDQFGELAIKNDRARAAAEGAVANLAKDAIARAMLPERKGDDDA